MNKTPRIFIWIGAWHGGVESLLFEMAKFLRDDMGVTPVLGVFTGEKDTNKGFEQIEVPRIFVKKLVAYNQIFASIILGNKLDEYDLVITHGGGFWKRKQNFFVYREPGDLDMMLNAISLRSKIIYFIPYMVALYTLKKSDLPVAASFRGEDFFLRHKIKNFLTSKNFIDTRNLPVAVGRQYSPSNIFNIVFIGRDDRIKNLLALKKTIELLYEKDANVRLHIFGINGKDTVTTTYHGWQSESVIEKFLIDEAHLFVLPSVFESSPLPLSMLKALALAVPSITSSQVLPASHKGIVVTFDRKSDLVGLIREIKSNYEKYSNQFLDFSHQIRAEYDLSKVLSVELATILKAVKASLSNKNG